MGIALFRTAAATGLLTVAASLVPLPAQAVVPPVVPAAIGTAPFVSDPVGDTRWGDVGRRAVRRSLGAEGTWSPALDLGSMYTLTANQGIQQAWAEGVTGKDVTVAVIDTGVAPLQGLDRPGKLMDGPDLSFEGQWHATRYIDGFGHGTHLAGIIAGRDRGWDAEHPDPRVFAGVAPDAQVLNLKVGSSDGGADVSQVIAALDWAVQHRHEGGLNVRVISLAYGTASPQPWEVDPLAHAVESAWDAGIVVVTAAGNDGLDAPRLVMPAADPNILAVGALDPRGTVAPDDDTVADFTNGGSATRHPDVVAPGRSVVSLRVPGGYADTLSPEGRVEGDTSGRFFRGSGTSQATAFVAGQVALLLQERPELTPDQVKALLVATARPLPVSGPATGAGVTDLLAALEAPVPGPLPESPSSSGTGSLELARGGEHVVDPTTGAVLTGERDAMGEPWNAVGWAAASSAGTSWQRGTWNGRIWTGDRFQHDRWKFRPWTGPSWISAGPDGQPITWDARSWREDNWTARSWRGDSWDARSWRQDSWEARSWREASWVARSWRDGAWEARSWREDSWTARSWRSLYEAPAEPSE